MKEAPLYLLRLKCFFFVCLFVLLFIQLHPVTWGIKLCCLLTRIQYSQKHQLCYTMDQIQLDLVVFLVLVATCTSIAATQQIAFCQPKKFIRCPEDVSQTCYIELTVSSMETLTAYCVEDVSNCTRGDGGYQVTINEEGGFDVKFPPSGNVTLFQPIVADGTTRRNLMVVNDQLPGPTIIGYKNQRVRINVTNNLGKEAITLHWHGQHVNGTSGSQNQFSDGVPFITQCPTLPSNSFVYDFRFYPAGTYWYHSHQYDERSDGMYGGLIILDPDETPTDQDPEIEDNPEEHTITLFEWFPVNSDSWTEAPYTLPDLVNTSIPYRSVPTNDGTGASSRQFFAGFMNFGGWRYNPSASDCVRVANNPLPFFNIERGKRYRFRMIGSQVTYAYKFSIAGHRLRVIATDGIDATIPNSLTSEVDFIIVHVGERYDFVLEASQPVDNYLMLIETLEVPSKLMEQGYCIKAHRGYAVLHYDGASNQLPANFDDSYNPLTRCENTQCFALNCPFEAYPSDLNITCIDVLQMELTNPEPVPDNDVSSSVFLNFAFSRGPSVNDRVFEYPQSPPLSQPEDIPPNLFCQYTEVQQPVTADAGPESSNSSVVPADIIKPEPPFTCVHTYTVTTDTVEMVFTNLGTPKTVRGGAAHPIHLHGHHYFVMDIGYPSYFPNGTVNSSNTAIDCSADGGICNVGAMWTNGMPPPSPCEANNTCPLKDTVIVPPGGYVRIRFPRDNWGWWIMHCHIEPHLLGGMAMVVNETSVPGHFPVPNGFPKCANFDFLPQEPDTPATLPVISPDELNAYKGATIALAVISFVLLTLLIAAVVVVLVSCLRKGGSKTTKVEVEMK